MRIYIPIALLIAALGIYFWVWQNSAAQVRAEVEAWVAEEQAAGRTANFENFSIGGFPYRLQIEFDEVELGDPVAGWSWHVDKLTGFVLPYRLKHIVLVASGDQRLEFLRLDRREIVLGAATDMRASIVLDRRGDLERFALDTSGLSFTRDIYYTGDDEIFERNESVSIGAAEIHTRRIHEGEGLPPEGRHHYIILQLANMTWQDHPYEGLGPDILFFNSHAWVTGLPDTGLDSIRPDFLEQWDQNGGVLYLDEAAGQWGEIALAVNGKVELDDSARLEGEMTILIGGHDRAIDALVAGGAIEPEYAALAKTVLDVIAALGGDPQGRIRAPLRMEDGSVYLGPAQLMELDPLY